MLEQIRFLQRFLAPTVLLAVLNGPCAGIAQEGAGPDSVDHVPQSIKDMLMAQVGIDDKQNDPKQTHLRFVRMEDLNQQGKHSLRFRLYAEGAPEDTPFTVAFWRIGTPPSNVKIIVKNAYVNRKGLLLLSKPGAAQRDAETTSDGSEVEVALSLAKGEPVRFVLRTEDGKSLIAGTLVAYPLRSSDKDCSLNALLGTPNGEAMLVYGDGFPPDSDVKVVSNSAGESKDYTEHTDARGHLMIVEMPFVKGKDSGTLKESVQTKGCAVSVEVPWGKGSYQPI